MGFLRMRSVLLAVILGLGALFVSISVLGMSPARAYEEKVPGAVNPAPAQPPPPPDEPIVVIVVFTDPLEVQITDLSGNPVGEGVHEGRVKCNRYKCSQNTTLDFTVPLTDPDLWSVEYKFATRQALDPEAERVVVEGVGTISGPGKKERFSFTATFENNRDGTVEALYVASTPDASFVIPRSAGTFRIFSRR